MNLLHFRIQNDDNFFGLVNASGYHLLGLRWSKCYSTWGLDRPFRRLGLGRVILDY